MIRTFSRIFCVAALLLVGAWLSTFYALAQNRTKVILPAPSLKKEISPLATREYFEAKFFEINCGTPRDRDEANLCEQKRMAEATERGVVVSQFGMLLVILSLFSSTWAAMVARRAANAAQKSVEVSSDTAKRQLRAYMNLAGISATNVVRDQGYVVRVKVDNVGLTPAKDWQCWAQIFYRVNPDRDKIRFSNVNLRSKCDIGSKLDHQLEIKEPRLPPNISFDDIVNKRMHIVVAGFFSYRDIFAIRRRGTFRQTLNVDHLENNRANFVICGRHNSTS